jgi:hypothetical protein
VISRARRVYFLYLERCSSGLEPIGVVLGGAQSGLGGAQAGLGRVVFERPVLLPDEQYIPLDLVRNRTQRLRGPRTNDRG